jgi:aminodeoxyfutalosine synthase
MLYGHVETVEDRVDHLLRLRELQDETGGFTGLIPLAFHPENTPLAYLPATSGQLDLRVIAVSRLLLDNFAHVKAYWIQIGTKLAQVALFFGADDLVGTVVDETITHAAGATTASGMSRTDFERLIRESGREPFERDAEYRRVVRSAGSLPVPRNLPPAVSVPV